MTSGRRRENLFQTQVIKILKINIILIEKCDMKQLMCFALIESTCIAKNEHLVGSIGTKSLWIQMMK